MTRTEYLNQLEQALSQLHSSARLEALDYFNEYFDEKADDQAAIEELGTPEEAAKEIIANLPEDALVIKNTPSNTAPPKSFDMDFTFDWNDFFSNFKNVGLKAQETIPLKMIHENLPEFTHLQIFLEDQSLTVETWEGETISFYYPVSSDGYDQSYEYKLVEDCLILNSKPLPHHLYFSQQKSSSAILKIPKNLLPLQNVTLTLRDSNLTIRQIDIHNSLITDAEDSTIKMEAIQSQQNSMHLEDTHLSLSNSQLGTWSLKASDAVLNLSVLNLLETSVTIEDCVWKLNNFELDGSLTCYAEDSVMTFYPNTDMNLTIIEEDSNLNLPKDKAFMMQKVDDTTHLVYKQDTTASQLSIHCQDCHLSVG